MRVAVAVAAGLVATAGAARGSRASATTAATPGTTFGPVRFFQCGDAARFVLHVAERDEPRGFRLLTTGRRRRGEFAIPIIARSAALFDLRAHVKGDVLAHDDVIAARIEGVTGMDRDLALTLVAGDFQSANHARAVQVAIVQFIFFNDVMVECLEITLSQQLAGEKTRAAETLQTATGRADRE
jgi:hypothetical protein